MGFRRLIPAAALLAAGYLAACGSAPLLAPKAGATPSGDRDVIAQLFEWNWPSVGAECHDHLGPSGYGYVQVSPPQEPVQGTQWWTEYQPVSYRIESRKGTRAEFAGMVTACHDAGVKVIADAVVNHMEGSDAPGTGWAGSSYGHFDYPGIYQYQDFHHCGRNGNDDIVNYDDRYEVQNCQLVHLADLDTGSDHVRDRIAGYLNDLLSLGVDGFRIDAAKHIAAADIAAIEAKLSRPPYIVQEVIPGPGQPIQPTEYTGNGDVHEFQYAWDLKRMFQTDKIKYLNNFGEAWGYFAGDRAVPFVANHDTERNGSTLSFRDGATYTLGYVFMLAWPYGSPTVMSGFDFGNNDQGAPTDGSGRIANPTCYANGWHCEQRWQPISGMVGFHNAVRGTAVTGWWDDGDNLIVFGRGARGFVVVNNENAPASRSYHTSLPAGVYCDVVHGAPSGGGCSGPSYSVNADGWFTATVGAHDAVALHV
ncbi:ATPase [Solihabitans fulvus]|uniref:Alpha-amylase n=1 Tax=Solihabitans fulvus TaxID=1892852 RepID=A0A5B2WZR8_9PSEU|nr:alpha-amylase family protein [Solihabitans fulvus]KAA2256106.1 ATPase [Solihabitans fulvus]